jgi:carbon-monoxide dehydrogenase small subunit
MLISTFALLRDRPRPSDDQIRQALSGNLCRCTGYTQMYQAIKAAIEAEQKSALSIQQSAISH